MDWGKHIISDKKVLLGKATIKGTRISVEHLIKLLSQGWTEEQILNNYPRLNREKLNTVFAYLYDCLLDGLLQTNTQITA